MATQHSRSAARMMMAPAVILLLGWMLVPLTMTLWFSTRKYLPLRGGDLGFAGHRLVGLLSFLGVVGLLGFFEELADVLLLDLVFELGVAVLAREAEPGDQFAVA